MDRASLLDWASGENAGDFAESSARRCDGIVGLAELGDVLASGDWSHLTVVVEPHNVESTLRFIERVLASANVPTFAAMGRGTAPVMRTLSSAWGIALESADPDHVASLLVARAPRTAWTLIAPPFDSSGWDDCVWRALATEHADARLLTLRSSDPGSTAVDGPDSTALIVRDELDAPDRRAWLGAIVVDAERSLEGRSLDELEALWSQVRQLEHAPEPTLPGGAARTAFAALLAIGEAVSETWLAEALGVSQLDIDALEHAALARRDGATVRLTQRGAALERDESIESTRRELLPTLARRLATEEDPWSLVRAAELFASAGDADGAGDAARRALTRCKAPLARAELWQRWFSAIEQLAPDQQRDVLLRTAALALSSGEADRAHTAAELAAQRDPDDPAVLLRLGQACVALGDLVAARAALARARQSVPGDERSARAAMLASEEAELAYLTGNLDAAMTAAQSALGALSGGTEDTEIELRARNTIGKLLLARAEWDAAESHFADDVLRARAARANVPELRARLNRGIALLSRGLVDEAAAIFEDVRARGEELDEPQATAYACDNLAVVAMSRDDYGAALEFCERSLALCQRFGHRLRLAHILVNVAELRARLGLFEHAGHAISFGRRFVGPGMPHDVSARFHLVSARLALVAGRTDDARRAIARALADGIVPNYRDELRGQAHRLAVRIALEDGCVAEAREMLATAVTDETSPKARAEHALLSVRVERAAGTIDVAAAVGSLELVRSAQDEELLLEAHAVMAELLRAEADIEPAIEHAERAVAIRERMASTLSGEVLDAFQSRADFAALDHLLEELRLFASGGVPTEPSRTGARPSPTGSAGTRRAAPRRELVGEDPSMRALRATIRRVAPSDTTVLVHGESGTGKEIVAEALHRQSQRADGPLVSVNCAALVETLLLSELFGHEKGAFTGASARRRGRFEMAEGGTLFLDEIGDISPRTQVALLRVLQERVFERVGGTVPIRANVRIVCATHRDLRRMVERGEFREDLYYRLCGVTIEVPALRQHLADVPQISTHLLERIADERGEATKVISGGALDLLARHRWPGNVRELENALRTASLFADGGELQASDFADNVENLRHVARTVPPPASSRSVIGVVPLPAPSAPTSIANAPQAGGTSKPVGAPTTPTLEGDDLAPTAGEATTAAYACIRQGSVSLSDFKRNIERECIARALVETSGNITHAAALLGMKRPRLSQLVKQYGLASSSESSS